MKTYIRRIALLGVLGAVLVASQVALAFLPNIEVVSLLIIIYACVLGREVFAPIAVFVLIEGMIYGFGLWWFAYIYTWPLLAVLALLFRDKGNKSLFTLISGAFGLLFGALCSFVYLFVGGPSAAFTFWTTGILFDILHCVGNVAAMLVLYTPVKNLAVKLLNNYT